ncbi:hypothetical protein GOP47_0028408, partial [Adiantum capillus-veneris]
LLAGSGSMASPSESHSRPSALYSTKRLQSFRRPGKEGGARHVPVEDAAKVGKTSLDRLQVLIPSFKSVSEEDSQGGIVKGQQKVEKEKTLVLSAGRQSACGAHNLSAEEKEHGDGDDINFNHSMYPSSFGIHVEDSGADGRSVVTSMQACSPLLFLAKLLSMFCRFFHISLPKQSHGKRIAAGKDVLATYHESILYGKVALSTRVRAGLRGPLLSSIFLLLECIAASLLLALYVRTTYTAGNPKWITKVQFCCSFFFLLDYIIKLYSAPVRLYYALSINGIIDFISTFPIYFTLSGIMTDAAIPEVFLVFRLLRAVPFLSSWVLSGGAVAQEICLLITYAFGVFFLAAGILQWVEWRATPQSVRDANGCPSYGCLSFFEAFYFIIVTVSTVGYGDITLKSNWGRLIAILVIIAAVVFIPVEVNKILDLASRKPYGGKYAVQKVVGSRFIIMSGNISYRALEDFLSEFYHPSHAKDMRAFPLRLVIMAPFKPSFEIKVLLTKYKGRVEFIEGTPLKDSDLERVSANVASAFFLMADHLAQDPDAEDAMQIMRSLSVHRFCGSKVRLIVEMLKPENQDNPIWDDADGGIEIVCPEAICYQLLARSCQVKGLSTFVINLFKSGLKLRNSLPGSWIQQYCHGQQQEIYPVILPLFFFENYLSFDEAAEIVYREFEIILFGLDILTDEETREVVLFPRRRILMSSDIGLVIAEDLAIAEKVSMYGKHSLPSWATNIYKSCHNDFTTSRDRGNLLIHDVRQKRSKTDEYRSGPNSSGSGKRREKNHQGSFGLMSSGHKAELQTQLREIVCASTLGPNGTLAPLEETHDEESNQQTGDENPKVYSLQEAVDLITQWPPLKLEKPDYSVLRKRAATIRKNLEERTMTFVNLDRPHVLLCVQGKWPMNLFYFVEQLRTPFLPKPPIVIMHLDTPNATDWGCVGMFDDVYFLRGSPIYEIDLLRAGVLQAEKVVLLSHRGRLAIDEDPTSEDNGELTPSSLVLDVDNVMITATLERLLHPVRDRILVELHREIEIHYLRPKLRLNAVCFDPMLYSRNRAGTFLFAPAFMEGKGFCSASLTFLLYALFFNRNTVAITEKMISGGEVVEGEGGEQVEGARLEQVEVPKGYEGRMYGEMVVGMLQEKQWLALGLYRPVGYCNSIVSYVYTNPPSKEILVQGDLVYVLR